MSAESTIYAVKLLHSQESGAVRVNTTDRVFSPGDHCIAGTPFGRDLARITGTPTDRHELDQLPDWDYHRPAEEADFARREANKPREREALQICRELVQQHRLGMNLVAAHYVLLDPRLLFYFTAENRA